jgi:aminoglycoside phosphotransferase (APT) family kinase protein
MHENEVAVDETFARRLIAAQFPQWADLPLRPVEPQGTDNVIFRVGVELTARFPRIEWAADQPATEHEWLPRLGPRLPLAVPMPLALGSPAAGYPWHWSICTWLPGTMATSDHLGDQVEAAEDLAGFVLALQAIDSAGGPAPGGRGGPLAKRDNDCRASIAKIVDRYDVGWLVDEWVAALEAPVLSAPAVWLHGDLDSRNLLATDGRLSGALDFASIAVGDPAADVMVAWKMFDRAVRPRFRDLLAVDDAMWRRARGWLLSQAVMILSYYTMETNRVLVEEADRWLGALKNDPV